MKLWVKLLLIFAGGVLGTSLRMGLISLFDNEVVALAAVNVSGCFLLGLISGLLGPYRPALRLFLAVGGLGAFTSWSTLALQSLTGPGGVVVAVAETAFGIVFAGLGHLAGMKLRGEKD